MEPMDSLDALVLMDLDGNIVQARGPLYNLIAEAMRATDETSMYKVLPSEASELLRINLMQMTEEPTDLHFDFDLKAAPGIRCSLYPMIKDDVTEQVALSMNTRAPVCGPDEGGYSSIARYWDFVQLSNDIIIEYDEDGTLTYVNPMFTEVLGYSASEILGTKIFELLADPQARIGAAHGMRRAAGEGIHKHKMVGEFLKKDGSTVMIQLEAVHIVRDGEVKGGHTLMRDVTEEFQKKKELEDQKESLEKDTLDKQQKLEESERKYKFIVQNAPIGVFIMQDGKLVFVNDHMVKVGNYSLETLLRSIPFDYVGDSMREALKDRMEKRLRGEPVPNSYEMPIISADGRELTVEAQITATTYNGRPAVMGILNDVTEKKLMQRLLVESAKTSAIGQVASKFAHEINSPLTIISLSTQNLRNKLDPDHHQKLDNINAQVAKIEQIIREVVTYSRATPVNIEKVDINQTIRSVVEWIQAQQPRDVEFEWDLSEEPPICECDEYQMRNMVFNVLITDIETLEGAGQITISTKKDEDILTIEVQDDGPHLEEELIPHMFEPFSLSKRTDQNYGLGLLVAQSIAKIYGGDVEIGNITSNDESSTKGRYVRMTISSTRDE